MRFIFALTGRISNLILCTLIFFLFSACNRWGKEKVDEQPEIPRLVALSVNDYWPRAMELAQKWQPDAYLLDASIDVELPHVEWSRNEVSFGFQSPSNPNLVLAVNCSGNFCSSEELTTTISLPQCIPLEINDSLLESQEALNLGLAAGGVEHIYSENAHIDLVLERNYPRCDGSSITWSVQFGNITTFERVNFIFDAVTGELLETR